MKIKIENGVTRYYDYEIEKAFLQYERGVSFYNYFKHKAQKFKYGEMAYYDIIKKEVEEYEQADWNYLIELRQIDTSQVCIILEDVEKIKKTLDLLITQQNEKPKPELTINQIALKYVYSEIQITRENGNKISKEYGHNSGEKLFQRFTYYSSAANRKGRPTPCTPKKLDNKIKLIESIIELLPTDKQERAKDEVLILKKIYEAEYQ